MTTINKKDFWECPRCKINSLNTEWCPCPRGSCEAEIVGKVITTIKIIKNDRKKI